MDTSLFEEYMQRKGYRMSEEGAYGMYQQYPVTFCQTGKNKWKIIFAATAFRWKDIQKELKRELKEIAVITILEDLPVITVDVSGSEGTQKVDAAMGKTEEILRNNNAEPLKTCGFCGKGNCDAIMVHRGFFRPVHDTCCNDFAAQAEKEEMRNSVNGSYLLGIIGALLGAVVGAIPSILSIHFMNTIYAILFALIPFCIAFGYKLFRGKRGPAAMILTILLSIIDVYLIEIVVVCVGFTTELGIPIGSTLSVVMEALKDPQMWVEMTKDCVSAFIFAAFGIYISWRYITNLNISPAQVAASLINTKVPYTDSEDGLFEAPAEKETAAVEETGPINI